MKFKVQNSKFKIIFTLFILFLIFASTPSVKAACAPGANGLNIGDCFAFSDIKTLGQGTSRLVVPIFSIASTLVIFYFLIGAFKYLKSGGNKEEVHAARQIITQSMIGFIILIFAFFILQFLLSALFGVSGYRIF